MKKFLKNWFTDNRKAGLMRWWLAGMCYFMIGFGNTSRRIFQSD